MDNFKDKKTDDILEKDLELVIKLKKLPLKIDLDYVFQDPLKIFLHK